MRPFLQALAVLAATVFVVQGGVPSAGDCGPTSAPGVSGCWGTSACADVISGDPGLGAASCGGTDVQLLPKTIFGSSSIGSARWPTQPGASKYPTQLTVIPSPSSLNGSYGLAGLETGNSSPASLPPALPPGGTAFTGTVKGQTITETFIPTSYPELSRVIGTMMTTVRLTGALTLAPPPVLPSVSVNSPGRSQASAPDPARKSTLAGAFHPVGVSSQAGQPDRSGQTVIASILSSISSLASTRATTTTDTQSNIATLVVGPGGVTWTPLSEAPSGVSQLPPPTISPVVTYAASRTQPGSSLTNIRFPNTEQLSVAQTSVSGAFDNLNQSETSIIVGGTTLHYSKETILSLSTITAPTTFTTSIVQTNKDGSSSTISVAAIIVGPGGTWWHGGTGGFGVNGPPCVWPFCTPGGGDDVDGSRSDGVPKDPGTPGSPEKPSNTDDDSTSATTITSRSSSSSSLTLSSASSTASGQPSGQPCSPNCAACNANPTKSKLKMPRRGLSNRTPKPPVNKGNGFSKRTLRTPANYGGNAEDFLLSEYLSAEPLNIIGTNGGSSTGFARPLNNDRYDATVHGLYGCTSVVVASQAGMWISHFWEIPSFRAAEGSWGRPRSAPDIFNFNDHVIKQMQNGGPDIPGLREFIAAGREFGTSQGPVWAIVTPRDFSEVVGSWRYEPEVNEIKAVLSNLFPAAPPVIIDYQPRSDEIFQSYTASGKILFQFDPFQALITDNNNPCEVYQQAAFRLWVEDRPEPVVEKYWTANLNQLITDFSSHTQHHKRENGPACQLPTSLPQASRETKGEDMTFSIAPDPGETHWITLGSSAGVTTGFISSGGGFGSVSGATPISKRSGSSANSLSPTTTPPMTTAPPPAPPESPKGTMCDCNKNGCSDDSPSCCTNGSCPPAGTSIPLSSPTVAPADPPAAASCRPIPDGKIKDSHKERVKAATAQFCYANAAESSKSSSINIEFTWNDNPIGAFLDHNDETDDVYDMFIRSVPGCTSDRGSDLNEPVSGSFCSGILYNAWSKCNNKGRGGSIVAGCLTYGIWTVY